VNRPNLMVKIAATPQGLPAITRSLAAGISVNVTLIFSVARYRQVIGAFLTGLEQAQASGRDLSSIDSVASFFVSRVDTEVDKRLELIATDAALQLRGAAAVANARLAYATYEEMLVERRWAALARAGASPQRPLWASTGVKNPRYPDTFYVTELVAPNTVSTMPQATLDAFADHGVVRGDRVSGTARSARETLAALTAVGIDLDGAHQQLEDEGVRKFQASWQKLCTAISDQLGQRAAGA
jgi:transaldolase